MEIQNDSSRVKVALRVRPLLTKEIIEESKSCVKCFQKQIIVDDDKTFEFDEIFDIRSSQEQIYEKSGVKELVVSCFEGYNATVLAYGQTSSGKTYTMGNIQEKEGIIPRAMRDIFEIIESKKGKSDILVRVSFIEIHNEEIHDLLQRDLNSKNQHGIREERDGSISIYGVVEEKVYTLKEIQAAVLRGQINRSTSSTLMNHNSSRSHAVLTIFIEQHKTEDLYQSKENLDPNENSNNQSADSQDENGFTSSKFHFVDLAGSERIKKTGAIGVTMQEGICINKGLLALGNVIAALTDNKSRHIPYRVSKLTRILQDSLGGNSKTLMIACVSPADSNYDETLNTLKYATRARNISNKPLINRDPQNCQMTQLKQQIFELQQLNMQQKKIIQQQSSTQDSSFEILKIEEANKLNKMQLELINTKIMNKKLMQKIQKMNNFLKDQNLYEIFHNQKLIIIDQQEQEDESEFEITSDSEDDDFQDDNIADSEIYEKEMSLVNENIQEKEKLLKNIESNQKIMEENLQQEIQKKYHEKIKSLEDELKIILKQRDEVILKNKQNNSKTEYQQKILILQNQLQDYKKKSQEQNNLQKLIQNQSNQINRLKNDIKEMKYQKTTLSNRIKEENKRFERFKKEKNQELYKINKTNLQKDAQISKLKNENLRKEISLKKYSNQLYVRQQSKDLIKQIVQNKNKKKHVYKESKLEFKQGIIEEESAINLIEFNIQKIEDNIKATLQIKKDELNLKNTQNELEQEQIKLQKLILQMDETSYKSYSPREHEYSQEIELEINEQNSRIDILQQKIEFICKNIHANLNNLNQNPIANFEANILNNQQIISNEGVINLQLLMKIMLQKHSKALQDYIYKTNDLEKSLLQETLYKNQIDEILNQIRMQELQNEMDMTKLQQDYEEKYQLLMQQKQYFNNSNSSYEKKRSHKDKDSCENINFDTLEKQKILQLDEKDEISITNFQLYRNQIKKEKRNSSSVYDFPLIGEFTQCKQKLI